MSVTRVRLAAADREPVLAVVALRPPPVEHREIQPAVEHDLLAAGAAGFERPPRVVQPHVDALHEVTADVDVVVLDEQDLAGKPRVAHQPRDLLQDGLARPVVRMGLSGEHQLDRHLWIVHERHDGLDVLENQIGPLVGGEPARESDRQRVHAQRPPQLSDEFRRLLPLLGALHRPPPRDVDQLHLQRLMRLPQLAVVDVVDRFPEARLAAASRPVGAQMPVVELVHLRREPGVGVNAVGDVADRHAIFADASKQRRPHRARDLGVQRRDGVGAARDLERQHRHAECFVIVVRHRRGPSS